MYFDRLTSISRNLTVGETTTALTITIESFNNFGRASQTVQIKFDELQAVFQVKMKYLRYMRENNLI